MKLGSRNDLNKLTIYALYQLIFERLDSINIYFFRDVFNLLQVFQEERLALFLSVVIVYLLTLAP